MSEILKVSESYFRSITTFTRPNDTTQYAAGDAVANATSSASILTFPSVPNYEGKRTIIYQVRIYVSVVQSTTPIFELRLFRTSFTASNDNTAFSLTDSEGLTGVAEIQCFETYTATNNLVIKNTDVKEIVSCDSGDTNLYGQLVAVNTYTPTANEQYTIEIRGVREL